MTRDVARRSMQGTGRANGRRSPAEPGGLDLSPRPTPPTGLPLIAATEAARSLAEEAGRLGSAIRAAEGRQAPVIEATCALRKVAAALLDRGAQAGLSDGVEALVAGWRLHAALPTLESALRRILDADDETWLLVRPRLVQITHLTGTSVRPRTALESRHRFAPIVDLVAALSQRPTPRPWPIASGTSTHRVGASIPAPRAASSLVDAVTDAEWSAQLAAKATDPDDAASALVRRTALETLASVLEGRSRWSWLDRNDRLRIESIASGIAQTLIEPEVGVGAAMAQDLAATATVLDALDEVRRIDGERFRRLGPVLRALRRLDDSARFEPHAVDLADVEQRTVGKRRLAQVVRRIADTSTEPVQAIGPTMIDAHRQLLRQRRQIEDRLLTALTEFAETPGVTADPRLAAMLSAQRHVHDDLRRLGTMGTWLPLIAGTPEREVGVRRQLDKLMRWLLDPNRRPDADRAARELERQIDAFVGLPAEHAIVDGSATAVGDRAVLATIRQRIRATREAWSTEWSVGNGGGPATQAMWRLHRLLRLVDAHDALADPMRRRSVQEPLRRWPDWLVPTPILDRLAERATAPLRAAAASDDEILLRRAERSAALSTLAVLIADGLRDAYAHEIDPLDLAAGSLWEPPGDAWLAEHRDAFGRIGVASIELSNRDRERGDGERDGALIGFVAAAADDLLQRLGVSYAPSPALHGFDGSDPEGRR